MTSRTKNPLHIHLILSRAHGHRWAKYNNSKLEAACKKGELDAARQLDRELTEKEDEEAGYELRGIHLGETLVHTSGTGRVFWDASKGILEIRRPKVGAILVWDFFRGEILCRHRYEGRHLEAILQCLRALEIEPPHELTEFCDEILNEETGEWNKNPHLKFLPSPVGKKFRVNPL